MAKTIKFNLICDEKPIRTLEGLRENFSIEDMLAYYENNLLHRWLDVRGYFEELDRVNSITSSEDIEVAKELIRIFGVEKEEAGIVESVQVLRHQKEREVRMNELDQSDRLVRYAAEQYWQDYQCLIAEIEANNKDFPKVKAAVNEIEEQYFQAFALDYRMLFYRLLESAPLAIFAMLMRPNMRGCYLPNEEIRGVTCYAQVDREEMHREIVRLISSPVGELQELIGENFYQFAGKTDQYWKNLVPKGTKCMVLKMSAGNFVRSEGMSGDDNQLGADRTNYKFCVLEGLDYMSNHPNDVLFYMEV